jgi:Lar family restriction alleviation protein
MKEPKLKRCPFCGGTPRVKEFFISTVVDGSRIEQQVICGACHSSGPITIIAGDAIVAWNRRYT